GWSSPVADLQARDGAHEWVSFEDPEEERTWVFDVTFMLSHWGCIFGRGCQGVLTEPAPELVQGCCSYGAHFVDAADRRRVERAATSSPGGAPSRPTRSPRASRCTRRCATSSSPSPARRPTACWPPTSTIGRRRTAPARRCGTPPNAR